MKIECQKDNDGKRDFAFPFVFYILGEHKEYETVQTGNYQFDAIMWYDKWKLGY